MKNKKPTLFILLCTLAHNQLSLCMMSKKEKVTETIINIPEIKKAIAKKEALRKLPDELLLKIFSYLENKEKKETIRLVNKEFNKIWEWEFFMQEKFCLKYESWQDYPYPSLKFYKKMLRNHKFYKKTKQKILDHIKHDQKERIFIEEYSDKTIFKRRLTKENIEGLDKFENEAKYCCCRAMRDTGLCCINTTGCGVRWCQLTGIFCLCLTPVLIISFFIN